MLTKLLLQDCSFSLSGFSWRDHVQALFLWLFCQHPCGWLHFFKFRNVSVWPRETAPYGTLCTKATIFLTRFSFVGHGPGGGDGGDLSTHPVQMLSNVHFRTNI